MILHLLTLLFVGLKLTGFITWAWWIVLMPSIVALALAVVLVLTVLLIPAYAIRG